MIPPAIEEVLESLYLHEVEQATFTSTPVFDSAAQEALPLGLVERHDRGYRLTQRGRQAGEDVVRRHRLAERLLQDVLAQDVEYLEEGACSFEHVLQHGLSEKVCQLLGHPPLCPHGKPIPPGPCCQKARADAIREVRPLCDGRPGEEGFVAYLATRNNREVQKLMAMGILPGSNIQLIQCFPSYVFQVGYSQFAVDRALAEVVFVRWQSPRAYADDVRNESAHVKRNPPS